MQSRAEVVVVGGGVTGTAVARDLAMRGADVLLLERDSLSAGTSGRMHGLLHSGARYAVSDPESARQCIAENRILRGVASHCVEDTGGLFVQLPEDDDDYFERKRDACEAAGIPIEILSDDAARREEPLLSADVERALRVPDAAIDPFRLVAATASSAESHGATIRTHVAVTDVLVEDGAVEGVAVELDGSEQRTTVRADHVVNAAGPWAGELAAMAGVDVPMRLAKGAMAVANVRQVDTVVNRCRPKTEADILVPHETTAILGTTDRDVADPESFAEEADELTLLIDELSEMVPAIADARLIRAYWGVRPLFDPDDRPDASGDVTRDFVVLAHADRDGLDGFTTVVGGKLTTHRLMAERVADRVAETLGIESVCRTAEEPLPGSDGDEDIEDVMDRFGLRSPIAKRTTDRLGSRTDAVLGRMEGESQILCECEGVTRPEIRDAIDDVGADVRAIRERTRAAMGTCQGMTCGPRIAGELSATHDPETGLEALATLSNERWKGQRYVADDGQLSQIALTYSIHGETYNRARDPATFRDVDLADFDGGDGDGA